MTGDPLALARELVDRGDLKAAAGAYDRAYARGFDVAAERRGILDRLAVEEHGIRFRYIPAGTFLMGSETGEPDERPVHPVTLGGYWLSEIPMTWSTYCDLMDWEPPPDGLPPEPPDPTEPLRPEEVHAQSNLYEQNKIRLQYCESETGYDQKPMISVAWQDAEDLCSRLSAARSGDGVHYGLPTEAEWEKAARGGLAGNRYAWGDEEPTPERCDFDRFGDFSIRAPRELPPNGYGLHGMSGTVWEWTSDWYDSHFYRESPGDGPTGPKGGEQRVLRGGSWSDCAGVVTVSFRMSRGSVAWADSMWGENFTPNVGFRLCRKETGRKETGRKETGRKEKN
jgi:formylglycine-generating enzyme required for sulfatase activity